MVVTAAFVAVILFVWSSDHLQYATASPSPSTAPVVSPASARTHPLESRPRAVAADAPPQSYESPALQPAHSPAVVVTAECAQVGAQPPGPHFQQVLTYVGPVAPPLLDEALRDLDRALAPASSFAGATAAAATTAPIAVFALDGTLLNLMRWGRIVNDNDVDVGILARGEALHNVSAHYFAALRALVAAGVVDEPDPRRMKKLFSQHKMVKPRRCVMRPQFMQCRHANGVIYDMFGPETVFSKLTGLRPTDVLPLRRCKSFAASFPCPRSAMKTLKQFTLQYPSGDAASKAAGPPQAHYEFAGCALLPPKRQERSRDHVQSIVETVNTLHRCGYPSLIDDLSEPACADALRAAGVTTTPRVGTSGKVIVAPSVVVRRPL